MASAIPHPVEPAPGATPPDGFIRVEHRFSPDVYWHFTLYLPDGVVRTDEGAEVPGLDGSASLGRYQLPTPTTDFEVVGTWLRYEIDPADWLDAELEALGYRIESRRTTVRPNGVAGDVVASWEHSGQRFVGRFVTAKHGARLYTVSCRCAESSYPAVAEQMLVAAASLRPLEDWPGLFAETVSFVIDDQPFDWKLAVPRSWDVVQHPGDEEGAWFEAHHLAPSAPDEQAGERDGRLALAVMTRASAQRPRDAARVFLDALRSSGVTIEEVSFVDDHAQEPFLQAWMLTSPIEREGARGEVRCRVMLHEHAWIVGGVVGPGKEDDRGAWMRNKRALDVATTTLEIDTAL